MDVDAVEAATIRRSQACKRSRRSVSISLSRFFKSRELTRRVMYSFAVVSSADTFCHFFRSKRRVGKGAWRRAHASQERMNRLNVATLIASRRKPPHDDRVNARHFRRSLSVRSAVTAVVIFWSTASLVQSKSGHECRRPAGRNAGAVFVSQDGLHGLQPHGSRCAAPLVAAYDQAAVVIGPLRTTALGRKPEVICSFQALPLSTLSWRRH